MAEQALIVMTTVGTEEEANHLAGELLTRRHAACVNIVPAIRSVYRWQGKICRDTEFLLLIKTMESEYDATAAAIRELHSYDVPEVLAFRTRRGDSGFLGWIESSLDKSASFSDEEDAGLPLPADD